MSCRRTVAAAGVAVLCCASANAAEAPITVPGLAAPAQIVVDRWGIPHLYAASVDDLYFVQGFNAARDRLFQIDLWRRRGLGRLAAAFGPAFVEQDRAARLFLYRGEMAREWRAYGPDAERIATRFVAGVNAWIDLVASDASKLPVEFARFGYSPEKWRPEDVVRIRSHGLTRNLVSEASRSIVACVADLKSDEVRVRLSPRWETRVPEGLDPCIAPEALRAYTLATKPFELPREGIRRSAVEDDDALRIAAAGVVSEGSNAWVIAPSKSATGRPILASDPHRLQAAPSLRYVVHLSAPGLDAIGGGEPSLPGVSIGHNGRVAFGLTIFAIDQEDLVVHEVDASGRYRWKGGWEPMQVVAESIPVRGGDAVAVELAFTRQGPVLHVDRGRGRAYALRTAWSEPGMAPYFGSIRYLGARDVAEFARAMATWGAPSENQLVADTAGRIGWITGGLAPIRPNWDGLLPVPGDGRYEWAGFWRGDQLPSAFDPPSGWLASANEQNLPQGDPVSERKLGFEWAPAARWQRIADVLKASPRIGVEDSMRLQNDLVSLPARRLQAVLRTARLRDGDAVSAARLLVGWDGVEDGGSAAAALFEVWWSRHLGPAVKDALLPRAAARLIRSTDTDLLLETIEHPGPALGRDAAARRDEIVERSLASAWAEMIAIAGADPKVWRWDRLHQVTFAHPLGPAADSALRARLDVGPFPKQGGGDTVNASSYEPSTLRHVAGPSFRIVVDVGDWDRSRVVNAPGQSGDPASPHYRDLAPLWLKGDYVPLLYSRKAVDAAAERRIDLVPSK